MRPLASTALWLLLAAGPTLAGAPADAGAPLPRIVVAFTNEPLAAPGPAGTTGSRYVGTGYGVGQSAQRQARGVASAYSLREVTSWPIQLLSMHCVVFEIANGRPVADVVAALSKDSRVALAQPLQEFHTLTTEGAAAAPSAATAPSTAVAPYNDPLYDLQTNMSALGIARAHERTQGAGVRVALIDTGVDVDHPDLRGAIVHSHSFIGRPVSSGSLRHGTAMAGLIAAVANNHIGIVGIAPRAQIEVFEACWQLAPGSDAASCNTFTLARALAAALASGAPLVNLSFAGPADPLLTALVQTGLKRGVTFVGAAAPADAPFPTAIPGVITAAGTEQPLPAGALAAPSQHVLTLRPGGEYDFESGTSVAAAEITAVLALLVSASPTRLPTATLESLIEGPTATAVASAVPPVDINAALSRLDATHGGRTIAARAPRP
jgi:subtilisin family serine protease